MKEFKEIVEELPQKEQEAIGEEAEKLIAEVDQEQAEKLTESLNEPIILNRHERRRQFKEILRLQRRAIDEQVQVERARVLAARAKQVTPQLRLEHYQAQKRDLERKLEKVNGSIERLGKIAS